MDVTLVNRLRAALSSGAAVTWDKPTIPFRKLSDSGVLYRRDQPDPRGGDRVKSLSAPVLAALSASNVVLVTLVKMEFPGGTIALNTSSWNISHGGTDYLGAAGLGAQTAITDKPGEIAGIQLELNRVDTTYITLALDDADQVQGSPITISTAILDASSYQVLHVETDWTGYADTMTISEDGETCSIGLTAESKAVDLLRGNPLVYNDADQQSLVPGDRIFEYVASQTDQPVVWPTRDYYYK